MSYPYEKVSEVEMLGLRKVFPDLASANWTMGVHNENEKRTCQRRRDRYREVVSGLITKAEGEKRGFTQDEKLAFDALTKQLQNMGTDLEGYQETLLPEIGRDGSPLDSRSLNWGGGGNNIRVLRNHERLADNVRYPDLPHDIKPSDLDLGRFVRGVSLGPDGWKGAEAERRAMSIGDSSLGGYGVPSPLSADVLDLARAEARVVQAGARTIPMESNTLSFAKVTGDPTASWKTENAPGPFSDMSFAKTELVSKTTQVLVKTSVELLEDSPNLSSVIKGALASSLALALDKAALYGSGAAAEPRGVVNTTGVQAISMGTNGAFLGSYDPFSQAVEAIENQNGPSSGLATIYAPRTAGTLDRLKSGDGMPMKPPQSYVDLKKLITNQVSITRTQGTSSVASDIFVGDFTQLLIGMRTQLMIEVSRQAGDNTTGSAFRDLQIWIRAYLRADVALARPEHFCVVSGIIPG